MIQCPACAGYDTEETLTSWTYKPVFAPEVSYNVPLIHCRSCTESFMAEGGDEIVKNVYSSAHRTEVQNILQGLAAIGLSRSYVERKLRMPPGTLVTWEKDGPGPGGLMLLRFVFRDPSILKLFPGTV